MKRRRARSTSEWLGWGHREEGKGKNGKVEAQGGDSPSRAKTSRQDMHFIAWSCASVEGSV